MERPLPILNLDIEDIVFYLKNFGDFIFVKKFFVKQFSQINFPFDVFFPVGLSEVIIYSTPDDKRKNRGFCFLEYESHKAASLAKRKLGTGRTKVWGCDIIVDWADPQEEPDEETMSKVLLLVHFKAKGFFY